MVCSATLTQEDAVAAPSDGPGRTAIVDGLRTPFAKRAGVFADLSAIDLGRAVVSELVDRNDVDPERIGQVVFGQVILDPSTPNIAREVVLGTGLPPTVEAYSVSKACITSYQTTVNVAQAIAEQVDPEHRQENRHARKDAQPGRRADVVASVSQHRSPSRDCRRDSQTEEAQTGFRDDRARHREGHEAGLDR